MSRASERVRDPRVAHPHAPPADATGSGLAATNVSKRFGTKVAVDRVSLTVRPATVHALLGENGAGKSTLISLMNGRLVADSGSLAVDDLVLAGGHPERFAAKGVATVYQDLMLVPSMTGLENIALTAGRSASRELRQEVLELQHASGFHAELDRETALLPLAERQRIELLRALILRPRYLLLDEPTTFLAPSAIAGFLAQVRDLAMAGIGVLFITHRLTEARAVADEVTVIRNGRVVNRYGTDLPDDQTLAIEIVGRAVADIDHEPPELGAVALRVRDLTVRDDQDRTLVDDCSLDVRRGEILGITGVDGNGQLELLEAIAGHRLGATGTVEIAEVSVGHLPYRARMRLGLQYISGERRRHGILPSLSVADHFRYMHGAGVDEKVIDLLSRHDVSPADPSYRADRLSGGNQQKMILARAFAAQSGILVLAYPTQGLDVLACRQVRSLLLDEAHRGTAIILATSELDEALAVCHRIAVMNRGRIVGIQARDAFDRAILAEWFTRDPAPREALARNGAR